MNMLQDVYQSSPFEHHACIDSELSRAGCVTGRTYDHILVQSLY